jgi:hypothetical protein
MQWGLDNVQLSSKYGSAYIYSGGSGLGGILDRIIDALADNDVFKYDFYLARDNASSSAHTNPSYYGYYFCTNIIQAVNGYIGNNEDETDDINILNLGQAPRSAIEYCYNKNKRNANGQVATASDANSMTWYLPAIDEIEEIMMSEYGNREKTYMRFLDFQGKYYWSSMPAYERNKIDYYIWPYSTTGEFYVDDLDRARSTRVLYSAGTYSTAYSGVEEKNASGNTNYTNTLYIRKMNGLSPRIVFTPTTVRDREGLYYEGENAYFFQDGNDARSQYNRVRCVRKAN